MKTRDFKTIGNAPQVKGVQQANGRKIHKQNNRERGQRRNLEARYIEEEIDDEENISTEQSNNTEEKLITPYYNFSLDSGYTELNDGFLFKSVDSFFEHVEELSSSIKVKAGALISSIITIVKNKGIPVDTDNGTVDATLLTILSKRDNIYYKVRDDKTATFYLVPISLMLFEDRLNNTNRLYLHCNGYMADLTRKPIMSYLITDKPIILELTPEGISDTIFEKILQMIS